MLLDVGRLPEGREEIVEPLRVDLVEREGDAEVRRLVLLGDRRGGRVQVGAEPAEIGDDALCGQRLEAAHGLGGVRLVVQQRELEGHLLAAHGDAAGGVQVLDGDLVAGPDLRAAAAVASGERHNGADLDSLGGRERRPGDEQREQRDSESFH